MVNHCYNRTLIDMNDIKVNLTEIYLNHPGAFEEWLVSDGNDDLIKRITEIKLRQKKSNGNLDEREEESGSAQKEEDLVDDGRTRRKKKIERTDAVSPEVIEDWTLSTPKKLKSQNG